MQVKDCLRHNEELRGMLDKLRTQQAGGPTQNAIVDSSRGENMDEFQHTSEFYSLKV